MWSAPVRLTLAGCGPSARARPHDWIGCSGVRPAAGTSRAGVPCGREEQGGTCMTWLCGASKKYNTQRLTRHAPIPGRLLLLRSGMEW